ncbi:MAG TPA: MFS transporter, partial [Solirubrobacteraceae bacterium]|nr:MFS transporter [Solirubrobacteraceae bacterium]
MELIRELFQLFRTRATRGGARESGLTGTSDLNVVNAAADAMVAIALASKLFFAVPTGQARGQVALYLLTTIAPFAVIAPIVGPLLDRFGRARRLSLIVTLVARAIIAWLLAGHSNDITIYPLALASLVFSKGFGVARSAVVPRIVPPGESLVVVNSRLQFASTMGSVLIAPIAAGISAALGYRMLLRVSALVFLAAILLVRKLPAHVDSPAAPDEKPAFGLGGALVGAHPKGLRALGNVPAALRGVLPLRAMVGFLTLFLAFYLRSSGRGTASLGFLAGAVALGNALGLVVGRAAGRKRPELLITVSNVLALLSAIAAAAFFSFGGALALAGVVSFATVMAKLALDAIIQRDVSENVRSSAFGRSETAVQLAWVAGGAVGLIPFSGRTGFIVVTIALFIAVVTSVTGIRPPRRRPRTAAGQPAAARARSVPAAPR